MKILIYGINYAPELVGIGKYSGEMGSWLAEKGYQVHVVTGPPYYPDWKVWPNFSSWFYTKSINLGITVRRCPIFVPMHPNSISRIFHLLSFAICSFPALLMELVWRPDIIFLVVPTLFCAPQALLLAKLTGAKSILHIQDFEVDAFLNLKFAANDSKSSILRKAAFFFESSLLKSFDRVSTISSGMLKRALDKGVLKERLLFLPNWAEVERFKNANRSSEVLNRFGLDGNKKMILYSGNLGEKQGLEMVLVAAHHLQIRDDLVFLIVGEGASKKNLMKMAANMCLTNVIFAPLQSYGAMPSFLASADVHLVVQRRGMADTVLPSKLANILAVGGNAVITADNFTTLGGLCIDHQGIAVLVEPESVGDLVRGIELALSMPIPNPIARAYAQKFLDKENVLSLFFRELNF